MVYVFLADGFEEIEALTPIDILRRVGVSVTSVGVTGKTVTGSHGISVEADITESEAADALSRADIEAVVLPGGMPGAVNCGGNLGHCDPCVPKQFSDFFSVYVIRAV